MAFMYTLCFRLTATIDSPEGLTEASISRGFVFLMLTPLHWCKKRKFRNECGHEGVKKPMNNRNQDDDNGTFIQTKGQLVRRDAHLSFG